MVLWKRVIFVDWHGVLSRDPFWASIRTNPRHPLRAQLDTRFGALFGDGATIHRWMRGELTYREVISLLEVQLDRRFRSDFLDRCLMRDCGRMRVNEGLMAILCRARARAAVVLATDNMDCFKSAFDRARRGGRRRGAPTSAALTEWAAFCDDVVCSSDVGALKSEDPARFFGAWLRAHAMSFADAVLIDDRSDNCEAFRSQGGTAVQWKWGVQELEDAEERVWRWLTTGTTVPTCPTSSPSGAEQDLDSSRV